MPVEEADLVQARLNAALIASWTQDKSVNTLNFMVNSVSVATQEIYLQAGPEDVEEVFSVPLLTPVLGIDSDCAEFEHMMNASYSALGEGTTPVEAVQWAHAYISDAGFDDTGFGDLSGSDAADGWGELADTDDDVMMHMPEQLTEEVKSHEWRCAKCTLINRREAETCVTCGFRQPKQAANQPTLFRQKSYICTTTFNLANEQTESIAQTASMLSCSVSAAATLLRQCKWDAKTLLSLATGADSKAFDALKHDAHIVKGFHSVFTTTIIDHDVEVECEICYDDVAASKTFAMACNHRFCTACWKNFLKDAVDNGTAGGDNCLNAVCPCFDCEESVGSEVFEMLCTEEVFNTYSKHLVRSYVDYNPSYTWCPAPNCDLVLGLTKNKKTVICDCFHAFCYKCKARAHAPATCEGFEKWTVDYEDGQGLDMKFILDTCKSCPKCGVKTFKDGGCMYISCRQCKANWCWQCGKGDHHVWKCNKPTYDGNNVSKKTKAYYFYYERYFNHNEALKITEKQRTACEERIRELVTEHSSSWGNAQFLLRAVELVMHCRRVLSFSYVRAYYIKKKDKRALLEYQQAELEEFTEKLNQLTESPLETLLEQRDEAIHITELLKTYINNVENGDFG